MSEHDAPIAIPMMICPACEEWWCPIESVLIYSQHWLSSTPLTICLIAKCSCGASWAEIYPEPE